MGLSLTRDCSCDLSYHPQTGGTLLCFIMGRKHSGVLSNARLSMKVGDLVRVIYAFNGATGLVVEKRSLTKGFRMPHYMVLQLGDSVAHQYLPHHLEIVK